MVTPPIPAGPRDFSLADRSETSSSCSCICKSTMSSRAAGGGGGWGYLSCLPRDRDTPGSGARTELTLLQRDGTVLSPLPLCLLWLVVGGCFSVELLLPPPPQGCKHSIKHERMVLPSLSLLVIM